MTILRSIAMAFAMFSKIPTPRVEWNDDSMHYMLAMFPLVGVVIALLLMLWGWLCSLIGAGQLLFAAGLFLIPLAVTGGIHIDGLMDTSDALGSHATPERKREILKDSRVGAFGVIALVAYVLLYIALATEIPNTPCALAMLGICQVMSRTTSGTISTLGAGSTNTGLLATFRGATHKRRAMAILCVFFALCIAGLLWLDLWVGLIVVACDAVVAFYTLGMAKRQFGGMSGDIAGWFLQIAEVAMLACVAIGLMTIG